MDAHIRADGQAFGLGLTHQRDTRCAGQATHMNASPTGAHQIDDGVQRDGFCGHGHATQTHSGDQGAAGRHAFAQGRILRSQPDAIAIRGGVLHGALQGLVVAHVLLGLRKTNATGQGEFGHGRQGFAVQTTCERTQWKHA